MTSRRAFDGQESTKRPTRIQSIRKWVVAALGSFKVRPRPSASRSFHGRRHLWGVSASLCGLVVAIAAAGLVGLASIGNVRDTTEGALRDDIAVQDAADDVRVAILEVRHLQRNLVFGGPSNDRLVAFEDAYVQLLEDIEQLQQLGISDITLDQPDELRKMAEEYYAVFRPALEMFTTDPVAFEAASNDGLVRLAEIERSARRIDRWAEEQGESAISRVADSSADARLILIIVIGGLIVVGVALVFAATRIFAEHRRIYEAEQGASVRLTEALQAKNDFIADASHELRTPLTVLRGNAEAGLLIEANCPHKEILEEIVDESSWMTRLVEDLLFLARSDAASPPLHTETIQITTMMDTVVDRAHMLVQQRGGSLSTSLAATGSIEADVGRVEQAILALIDNAAKYSPPGGKVRIASSIWRDHLIVEVADEGAGIAEEDLSRIFERFYRIDKARSRRQGGAGLGLSIARTIVEAHGGRIEAQSRLGVGTRMRLILPLVTTPWSIAADWSAKSTIALSPTQSNA